MGRDDGAKCIELFVGCRIGTCSDKGMNCFAVVLRQECEEEAFEEIGRSETICNSWSPQFCTSFEAKYAPTHANETMIRIEVYERLTETTERLKDHDYIGKATFSIEEVLAGSGNHVTTQLSHPSEERKVGIVTLSAEEIDVGNDENESDVQLDIKAGILRKRDWNKTLLSQRYEVRRAHKHEDGDGHTVWLPIYKSDRVSKQRDSNDTIEFSSASVKYRHLCNGDDERRIRLVLFGLPQSTKRTVSSEVHIGTVDFSLRDICEIDPTEEVLQLERGGDEVEDIGHMTIVKAEPTDFGSHFSMQVNYEDTSRYSCMGGAGKGLKKKYKLSMPRRLSVTSKDRATKSMSEIRSSVDTLFSSSFRSSEGDKDD